MKFLGRVIVLVNEPTISFREIDGSGNDRVQDGLEIQRRADRSAHLPERPQLINRSRQLDSPRLELSQEPGVLDGDHRLVGEGGDQLDLLVGKGLNLILCQREDSQEDILPEHWHSQVSPLTAY